MHQTKPHNGSEPPPRPPTNYVPEDDNGNLTVLDHRLGASSVARYDYTYDANGMRTSKTDLDGLHEYGYDTLYQIIQATHPTVTNPTEAFQYDAAGNRLFDEERAYSYNELNQLVEDNEFVYEYDLDGNMTLKVEKVSGDSTKFFWDIENRLVRVERPDTEADYAYGPFGRRLARTVSGVTTEFRYDGDNLILELGSGGNVTGFWTYGPRIDEPLAMNRNGTHHYYLADALGSVTALTDESGIVVQSYEYGVYGEIMQQTGSLENPFAYTGREWEPEADLYYYRARWYYAAAGKWCSRDRLWYALTMPNLYMYVFNAPSNFIDPSGLRGFLPPPMPGSQPGTGVRDGTGGWGGYGTPLSGLGELADDAIKARDNRSRAEIEIEQMSEAIREAQLDWGDPACILYDMPEWPGQGEWPVGVPLPRPGEEWFPVPSHRNNDISLPPREPSPPPRVEDGFETLDPLRPPWLR